MKGIRYAEGLKVLPVLAPVDTASSAVSSGEVWLREAHWVTFLVNFGNFTSDSTDVVVITVESSTSNSTAATDEAPPSRDVAERTMTGRALVPEAAPTMATVRHQDRDLDLPISMVWAHSEARP